MKYQGIFPAMATPYDAEGKICPAMIEKLVNHLIAKGVSGLYVAGSTGESYLLSLKEREMLLEEVIRSASGRVPVIASIGVVATEDGKRLARHAEKAGAAAVSAVPPIYFPFTKEECICYYEDLASAVDIPVMVYNIPAMSGVHFTWDDLERLMGNDGIMGLKHTSYDLFQLQQLIRRYPEKQFFVGYDELYLSARAVGAAAGIGSSCNSMPEKFIRLHQLFAEHRMEEALLVQDEINGVIEVLTKVGVFKGIKEILRLQGFDCGECRRPFLPLTGEEKNMVRICAEKYRLL